jgi:hypothetical protein
MTDGARDAVARQRAVLCIGVAWKRVDHAVLKRFVPVQLELSLAHHAMTAIAGVIEKAGLRRAHRLFRFQLRMKNWIASGESHHRRAPFCVRRKIQRGL